MRRDQHIAQGIQLLRREAELVSMLPLVLVGALEVREGLADDDL